MNPATLKMALSAATTLRGRVKDYREEKAREAYDLLSEATSNIDFDELKDRSATLLDDSRREAGNVTQAARARLEKAREDLESRRADVEKKAGKSLTKAKKNLPSQKQAAAAKRRKGWGVAGGLALLAALAGGAYYWFIQREQGQESVPPRVEDFSDIEEKEPETESTLVYSTTTPTDASAGPLGEDPAERDEELLGSLDEQLQQHKNDSLTGTDSVDDVTDPDVVPELTEDDKDNKA